MKQLEGLRVDQIAVVRIEIDPTETSHTMRAEVALMDSRLAQTVAFTKSDEGWSPKTREALSVLIASMEDDVAAALQEGEETSSATDGTGTKGGLF